MQTDNMGFILGEMKKTKNINIIKIFLKNSKLTLLDHGSIRLYKTMKEYKIENHVTYYYEISFTLNNLIHK